MTAKKVVAVLVRLQTQKPWEREWIAVDAASLDEACRVAEARQDVAAIFEAAWDTGYIT